MMRLYTNIYMKIQVDFISVDFERKTGKRQKSREKEKNLQRKRKISEKKRNFSEEIFFQRKFSFSLFVHF